VYPYVQYLPIFANEILHVGAEGYGVLSSGLGFGSIAGALLLTWLGDLRHKGWVMLLTLVAYQLLIVGFALSTWFPLSMACLVVSGLFHSIYSALNNTVAQLAARTEFRGRVMALFGMTFGLTPFGALPMGFLIAQIGAPLSVALFVGLACLTVFGLAAASPALRKA
jgi:MFS family permease